MTQQNQTPSFFEPRTILAIVLVGGMYFGWQAYIAKKYPGYGQKPVANPAETKDITVNAKGVPSEPGRALEAKKEEITHTDEKLFPYDSENLGFTVTSRGMGIKDVRVNNYEDKDKNKIQLGVSETETLFELRLGASAKPLDFEVQETSPGHFVGTANVGAMSIVRDLAYDPAKNAFTNTVTISNATDEILKGISFTMPEKVHVAQAKSFLFPSIEHQDFLVIHNGGSSNTVNFSGAKENLAKEFSSSTLVAMGSQYFAAALLDKSDILPDVHLSSNVADKTAQAVIAYKPSQAQPQLRLTQILYAGPKSIDSLKAIDAELPRIIDFGFFGMISRPLVYIMKAFHSYVGNWGFSIILLTLLVRFCVLPFNIMSVRSMKAMQKIQPKMQALREKYKADPMTLNKETMALMKQSGANPLGGCLPMLIQIPIFFALYRVIGSSIELYHSPFIGWITDLSSHDKFYVLPVLMGISMFLQQKFTPSTMDPTQAKIMMFLPIVFSVFMLQLPSGLTLYMFVSTLFGMIQQFIIMRDKTSGAKA